MGELLLCSQDMASMPYYIEHASLNVYSLEELSYYLMHNTDLIEPEFMDEELCAWIDAKLKMPELAKKLRQMIAGGMSLLQFVEAILKACGYCTQEEMASIYKQLQVFEDKSEIECRKIRADRFQKKKRYAVSMLEYQKLLAEAKTGDYSLEFTGNVWHNLGTAYAKLFLFEEAAECYGQAFLLNQNQISLEQKQEALRLFEEGRSASDGAECEKQAEVDSAVTDQMLRQWIEEYKAGAKL